MANPTSILVSTLTLINPVNAASTCGMQQLAQALTLPHPCCRVTEECNAWFFCEDDRGCYDWQTQLTVDQSQCVLMAATTRPQPEPKRGDLMRPLDFSSYQAGYLKGRATHWAPLRA